MPKELKQTPKAISDRKYEEKRRERARILKEKEERIVSLEAALKSEQGKVSERESEILRLTVKVSDLEAAGDGKRVAELEKENAALRNRVADLEQDLRASEKNSGERQDGDAKKINALHQDAAAIKKKAGDLQIQLDKSIDSVATLKTAVKNLEKDSMERESRIEELKERQRNTMDKLKKTSAALGDAEKKIESVDAALEKSFWTNVFLFVVAVGEAVHILFG